MLHLKPHHFVYDTRLALVGILLAGGCAAPSANASMTTADEQVSHPALSSSAALPEQTATDPDQVDFAANTVAYDELGQTITAEGDVEIAQDGKIVRASKVVYDLPKDKVEAIGEVVMMDESGDVHFAERVELERKL